MFKVASSKLLFFIFFFFFLPTSRKIEFTKKSIVFQTGLVEYTFSFVNGRKSRIWYPADWMVVNLSLIMT